MLVEGVSDEALFTLITTSAVVVASISWLIWRHSHSIVQLFTSSTQTQTQTQIENPEHSTTRQRDESVPNPNQVSSSQASSSNDDLNPNPDPEIIRIKVKMTDDSIRQIDIDKNCTVYELKQRLFAKELEEDVSVLLLFSGQRLQDHLPLARYPVFDGCTFVCTLRNASSSSANSASTEPSSSSRGAVHRSSAASSQRSGSVSQREPPRVSIDEQQQQPRREGLFDGFGMMFMLFGGILLALWGMYLSFGTLLFEESAITLLLILTFMYIFWLGSTVSNCTLSTS
jgi:hypothetical protein